LSVGGGGGGGAAADIGSVKKTVSFICQMQPSELHNDDTGCRHPLCY
jgi:hypothetical protein